MGAIFIPLLNRASSKCSIPFITLQSAFAPVLFDPPQSKAFTPIAVNRISKLRRAQLLLQYYVRAQQQPQDPTFSYLQPVAPSPNTTHSSLLGERVYMALQSIGANEFPVIPFKFAGHPWLLPQETFCTGFDCPTNRDSIPQQKRSLFLEHCESRHMDSIHIFTDGSKSETLVGSSAVQGDDVCTAKLPENASIFTAELCGIQCALDLISDSHDRSYTIFSDSKSAIQALHHYECTHPVIIRIIRATIRLATAGKVVKFC